MGTHTDDIRCLGVVKMCLSYGESLNSDNIVLHPSGVCVHGPVSAGTEAIFRTSPVLTAVVFHVGSNMLLLV